MRRSFAGLHAARSGPATGVQLAGAALGVLLLAACGPAQTRDTAFSGPAATAAPSPTAAPTAAPTTTPAATPPSTTPAATPTPERVAVPAVVGTAGSRAAAVLAAAGMRVRTTVLRTGRYRAGTVVSVSPPAGTRLLPGSAVTLTVAQPSPVARTTAPAPQPTAAPGGNCDPSYSGACLKDGIGDYDCSSGSGNGPNYVDGPITVRPPDPFGLDRDGDGIGCEDG